MPESVLKLVNAARSTPRHCGARAMPAALPLAWNATLLTAARQHSEDMARREYFDHTSPDGQRADQRATAAGYRWRAIGENIAGGQRDVGSVVAGWLHSPGHCSNLMSREFDEFAVACVEKSGSPWGTYWTMVLGRRR